MANPKARKKHKPPARVRYEQSHPTVSFRLPKELCDQLKDQLAKRDITAANFVKEALAAKKIELPDIPKIKQSEYSRGYYEGYQDGYEQAKERLPYPAQLITRRDREEEIRAYRRTKKGI